MKAALVFAGRTAAGTTFRPYRSRPFLATLAASGIEPVVVDVDLGPDEPGPCTPVELAGLVGYHNAVDRLPLIVAQERVDVVQTFGATIDLAPVWRHAARAARPILHYVASEGAIEDGSTPASGLIDLARRGRGLPHVRARRASRHVSALIGSNCADIGRHVRDGFFPRARFSVVAPPPAPRPVSTNGPSPVLEQRLPVFGFHDPDADPERLDFLLRAVALTGQTGLFALRIAPAALAERIALPPSVTAVDAASPEAFLRDVDVLIVPRADDRALAAVVAALAARRSVVVPDTGAAAELVGYGRRGLLYAAGSAYELAMALNVMAEAWTNRPFSFEGVDEAIARTAPEAVAAVFAAAWRRLPGRGDA